MLGRKSIWKKYCQIVSQYGGDCNMKFSTREYKVIQLNDEMDNQWVLENCGREWRGHTVYTDQS